MAGYCRCVPARLANAARLVKMLVTPRCQGAAIRFDNRAISGGDSSSRPYLVKAVFIQDTSLATADTEAYGVGSG